MSSCPAVRDPDCDCECHDVTDGSWDHPGYDCAEQRAWLDDVVQVRLTSLLNVSFRHVVPTLLTNREWLDMDDDAVAEELARLVADHVEVTVLDDPRDGRPDR